jgi:hypothetical protein
MTGNRVPCSPVSARAWRPASVSGSWNQKGTAALVSRSRTWCDLAAAGRPTIRTATLWASCEVSQRGSGQRAVARPGRARTDPPLAGGEELADPGIEDPLEWKPGIEQVIVDLS